MVLVVKNPPVNARDIRDTSLIPELGISSGGGDGIPLPIFLLEYIIDRGAWWATAYEVAKRWTRLSI